MPTTSDRYLDWTTSPEMPPNLELEVGTVVETPPVDLDSSTEPPQTTEDAAEAAASLELESKWISIHSFGICFEFRCFFLVF